MAKKKKRYELSRKQFKKVKAMDHNDMTIYMNEVYEKGMAAVHPEPLDIASIMDRIAEIKGIGVTKLEQIEVVLTQEEDKRRAIKECQE